MLENKTLYKVFYAVIYLKGISYLFLFYCNMEKKSKNIGSTKF